jgi:hypothetical protein
MAGEVMPTVGGFDASKMGPIIMPAQGAMPAGSGGPYSGMFADGGLQNIMDHMPGYKSIMNGSGGTLGAPYSVGQAFDPTKIPGFYDKTNSSINDLSSMAHQGGLTQLGQMQDQQLSGSALRSAQSAGNQNLDRLAVQGGVSSGAGERMASSNMVNQANQVNAAHTNVSMNDAQFKQNILGQLPSMYGQVAQSEQQGALQRLSSTRRTTGSTRRTPSLTTSTRTTGGCRVGRLARAFTATRSLLMLRLRRRIRKIRDCWAAAGSSVRVSAEGRVCWGRASSPVMALLTRAIGWGGKQWIRLRS